MIKIGDSVKIISKSLHPETISYFDLDKPYTIDDIIISEEEEYYNIISEEEECYKIFMILTESGDIRGRFIEKDLLLYNFKINFMI